MGMDEIENIEDIEAHGAPATADALRSIVARHQRARTRALGIALVVALVAGPLAGWAVARRGEGGGQEVATSGGPEPSRPDAKGPRAAASGGGGGFVGPFGGPNAAPAHHLFTRTTADGIVIRAYRTDPPPLPAGTSTTTATRSPNAPEPGFACAGAIAGGRSE